MTWIRKTGWFGLIVGLGLSAVGCDNKLLDPTQIGRFRPTPAVNVILDSLGVAEETPVAWEQAEGPRPADVVAVKGDYTLRGGDIVRISVFELFQEDRAMTNDYVVSETGKISIPEVGVVQAAGLTETQLEDEIKQILSPAVLKEPSVNVTLITSQQRTFSVLGNGVPQPGRYALPRYNFRLTDALATAGGPMQFNVSHIYVARGTDVAVAQSETGVPPTWNELKLIQPGNAAAGPSSQRKSQREIPEPSEPAEQYELEREMMDMIAPSVQPRRRIGRALMPTPAPQADDPSITASDMPRGFRVLVPQRQVQDRKPQWDEIVVSPSEMGGSDGSRPTESSSGGNGRIEWVFQNGKWVPISIEDGAAADTQAKPAQPTPTKPKTAEPSAPRKQDGQIEWVQRNGQWVPVIKGAPTKPKPPTTRVPEALPATKPRLPMEAEWDQAVQTRLIKIPADKLLAGDPRYNIVIKPGDTVYVPVDLVGEFCITGNVNRSGYVSITGRPMTLKMAIAAAGGLGPLAYPKYCEVVRRIGDNREEIVMVDLDKIASGEQPDFFIKPNDLINVGTHPSSRWRAVLRNAFRATYGFGFVYDRNFAYSDESYGTSFL